MLLCTLGVSLLGNLLISKGTIRAVEGTFRAVEGTFRVGQDFYCRLILQQNCVYSRNNLPKIKDGAFVINLDKFKSIETHWIDLYVNNNVTYFDNFGVEHIPKKTNNS